MTQGTSCLLLLGRGSIWNLSLELARFFRLVFLEVQDPEPYNVAPRCCLTESRVGTCGEDKCFTLFNATHKPLVGSSILPPGTFFR